MLDQPADANNRFMQRAYMKITDPEIREWVDYILWRINCIDMRAAVNLLSDNDANGFVECVEIAMKKLTYLKNME